MCKWGYFYLTYRSYNNATQKSYSYIKADLIQNKIVLVVDIYERNNVKISIILRTLMEKNINKSIILPDWNDHYSRGNVM